MIGRSTGPSNHMADINAPRDAVAPDAPPGRRLRRISVRWEFRRWDVSGGRRRAGGDQQRGARHIGMPRVSRYSSRFRTSVQSVSRLLRRHSYLAFARLARAARLLENRSATLAAAADQLEYSSAQSFGRHVRMLLGIGAAQFRREYDAERMLARFRDELVAPYAPRLRRFAPLGRV